MIKFIDMTGKTEDEAIRRALEQLGLERDDVSVEILERAKSGFLGIGGSPATVRVSYDDGQPEPKPEPVKPEPKSAAPKAEKKPVYCAEVLQKEVRAREKQEREAKRGERRAEPKVEKAPREPVVLGEEVRDGKSEQIRTFLSGLLEHMDAKAEVKVYEVEKNRYKVILEGEKLGALIEQYGGFIESSSVRGVNIYNRGSYGRRSADYTVRIPSKNFSTLMNELPGIGNVPYTHTYTENITAQYYDAQARLTAYETQEQSLLAMLEKAETVEDIINIEDKLTDVRYNIDSVKSRLTNWDRQVSYSTVNLSVEEVVEYSPEAKISYGERLWLSLKNGLQSVGDFFSDFLVWLVGALPALVILAVLIIVLLPLLRKWSRRSREKRAARKAAKAEKSGEN